MVPAQFGRRVGVGIGYQLILVKGRKTPVHCGIRGKPCLQSMYVGSQILKAFLYGIKA